MFFPKRIIVLLLAFEITLGHGCKMDAPSPPKTTLEQTTSSTTLKLEQTSRTTETTIIETTTKSATTFSLRTQMIQNLTSPTMFTTSKSAGSTGTVPGSRGIGMEMFGYIGGICAIFLIGITVFLCVITLKRQQKNGKINNEIVNASKTTISGTELQEINLNSRTTFDTERHTSESPAPYYFPENKKHNSVEYVLHDPSKSVVIQNIYQNCS